MKKMETKRMKSFCAVKKMRKKIVKSEKWTSQEWENGPKNSFNSVDHDRNRMKSEKFQPWQASGWKISMNIYGKFFVNREKK